MSFIIEITNIPIPNLEPGEKAVYGEITIANFRERFYASIEYWSGEDYRRQWIDAIGRLLGGSEHTTSGLIADMHDPSTANLITCWALYREVSKVYVHNKLLFLDKLSHPFRIEEIGSYIGGREIVTEEGDKISEWTTSVAELKEFLDRLKKL